MNNLDVRVQVDQIKAGLRESMRSLPRSVVGELGLYLIAQVQAADGSNRLLEICDALALIAYGDILANMLEVEEANK